MQTMEIRRRWQDLDFAFLAVILCLVAAGVVFVSSATHSTEAPLGIRQFVWSLVASAALLLGLAIPYSIWIDYGYLLYGSLMILMLYLPLFGTRTAGARSWFKLGFISLQPSELAKVALILACAGFIKSRTGSGLGFREIWIMACLAAVPIGLTLAQPDFGTATTFLPVAATCLFLSKFPLSRVLKWAGVAALAALLLFSLGWLTVLRPYQKERIRTFVNPAHDPRGAGYQVNQAKIAVGSGQLLGKGLHSGTQNRLSFLPKPHTDFIFGVIAEETGFLGSMVVLGLFLVFFRKLLDTARQARDPEGRFLVVAAFALLLYHVLINVGMVLGVLPTTGIPLPFLSYGGSSLLAMSWLAGLVLNVRWRRFGEE